MHPCQFKVRLHVKGERKKTMLASFAFYRDAINFAHDQSRGAHNSENETVAAYMCCGKIGQKFRRGQAVI